MYIVKAKVFKSHEPISEVFLDILISVFTIFFRLTAERDLPKTDTSCVIGSDERVEVHYRIV